MRTWLKVLRARVCQARANRKMRRALRLKRQSEALAARAAQLMAEARQELGQPGVDRRRAGR